MPFDLWRYEPEDCSKPLHTPTMKRPKHLKSVIPLVIVVRIICAIYGVNKKLLDCHKILGHNPLAVKERSKDQTAISVSLPKSVLAQIDGRAGGLGVGRSRYLVWLAQHDIAKGGDLTIPMLNKLPPPAQNEPPLPADDTIELARFLEFAIPALDEFMRNLANPAAAQTVAPPSETGAEAAVWEFFLTEREEILKLKWIESEKARRDIGWEQAIQIWMHDHRRSWVKDHPPHLPPP
jgi:hypothetical protein